MIDGLQIVVESAEANLLFLQMMQASVRAGPSRYHPHAVEPTDSTCVGVTDCDHTGGFSRRGAFTASHHSVTWAGYTSLLLSLCIVQYAHCVVVHSVWVEMCLSGVRTPRCYHITFWNDVIN